MLYYYFPRIGNACYNYISLLYVYINVYFSQRSGYMIYFLMSKIDIKYKLLNILNKDKES